MKFLFITDVISGTEQQIARIFLVKPFQYSWMIFNFKFVNYFNQITPRIRCDVKVLTVEPLRF